MEEAYSSQFFNTIPEKEGTVKHQILDDKKLELRLAPPGGEFLGSKKSNSSHFEEPAKRQFDSSWLHGSLESSGFSKVAQVELQGQEKKKCTNPDTNVSHKRVAPAPVVGWPPIRSFRKNLQASSTTTSKAASESPPPPPDTETQKQKDMFVKINMEGVPIGRKINLNAYDNYEKLSLAVDRLFRDLLAAQRNGEDEDEEEESAKSVACGGEYTLVYEDNEGDRVLVGDVPWHMFVSTAKRLRVLKSSEISKMKLLNGE